MSNPPHFVDQYEGDIRAHDPDWQIHRNFFETVSNHLAEDGVIVLQENNRGSIESFRAMIEQSGFEIFFTHGDYPLLTKESSFYFIGIGRRGQRPSWAGLTFLLRGFPFVSHCNKQPGNVGLLFDGHV